MELARYVWTDFVPKELNCLGIRISTSVQFKMSGLIKSLAIAFVLSLGCPVSSSKFGLHALRAKARRKVHPACMEYIIVVTRSSL